MMESETQESWAGYTKHLFIHERIYTKLKHICGGIG